MRDVHLPQDHVACRPTAETLARMVSIKIDKCSRPRPETMNSSILQIVALTQGDILSSSDPVDRGAPARDVLALATDEGESLMRKMCRKSARPLR